MAQQQPANQQSEGALSVQGPQMMTGEELRATRDPGQLVGGEVQGVGALRGQADAAGQAARQATRQAFNPFGTQGRFGMNQFSSMYGTAMMNSIFSRRQQLRMPLTLGFTPVVRPSTADVGARVQTRLTKIPRLRGNGPLTVEMDGRVAVLRGEVASKDDRDLIARVVLLEPGVSDVRNELQVAKAKTAP
jgi:osmotically-inducible protein OsmY